MLSDDLKEELKNACSEALPGEACGFIASGRVIQVPNRSADISTFRIVGTEAEAILREEGLGLDDIAAVWHTHPSGNVVPSDADLAAHPWPWALVVATVSDVSVTVDAAA